MLSIVNFSNKELGKREPAPKLIFEESLRVMQGIVPEASFMDIRLLDHRSGKYMVESTLRWGKSSGTEMAVSLPDRWAQQIYKKDTMLVLGGADYARLRPLYLQTLPNEPDTLVIAPIPGRSASGILEIGLPDSPSIPKHISDIARIIAKEVGLYHSQASTIQELNQTKARLVAETEEKEKRTTAQPKLSWITRHLRNQHLSGRRKRRVQSAIDKAKTLGDCSFENSTVSCARDS